MVLLLKGIFFLTPTNFSCRLSVGLGLGVINSQEMKFAGTSNPHSSFYCFVLFVPNKGPCLGGLILFHKNFRLGFKL